MNITKLPNGNLQMQADVHERNTIATIRKLSSSELAAERQFICDYLGSYEQVRPEDVGALTDAPLISDGDTVWGYMDYQVSNFLERLQDGKEITWTNGLWHSNPQPQG